jgi:hypothetical protein
MNMSDAMRVFERNSLRLTLRTVGLSILIVLSFTEFVLRGPARFSERNFDFLTIYVQTALFSKGMDPYDIQNVSDHWPADAVRPGFLPRGPADQSIPVSKGIPAPYPPSSFLLLSPLAWGSWTAAQQVWSAISVVLSLGVLWALAPLLHSEGSTWRLYIFIAMALAFAPIHTGLATGNIGIPATALCLMAVGAGHARQDAPAGVLLALGTCLKPTIGAPFVLFYLICRRWKLSAWAVTFTLIISSLGILRLMLVQTSWFENYTGLNRVLLQTGVLSDFTDKNPMRFGLLNLQVLLYALMGRAISIDAPAAVAIGTMFVAWLLLSRQCRDELLTISALAVLSLLAVYHRFYDAGLLLVTGCWSLREFHGPLKRFARAAFVTMLPFLAPGGTMLQELQFGSVLPERISTSWWWSAFVMPHQVWMLIAMFFVLLAAMNRAKT